MKTNNLLTELNSYSNELGQILRRFKRSRDGIHIADGDDSRFRQIAFEVGDLIKDEIVDGHNYYSQIRSDYNESISNWLGSPSFAGVQRVKTVIDSVITRIKRNPDIALCPMIIERPGISAIRSKTKYDRSNRQPLQVFATASDHSGFVHEVFVPANKSYSYTS